MQSLYGGKTNQSLPRFKFPDSFTLSVNKKHYSNTEESLKFFNEIIIPYIKSVQSSPDISADQYALVIMDVFTGQMTSEVLNLLRDNKILLTNVPPNIKKFYQPLDLTVNGYAKRFMARKFNHWYTEQVSAQLDKGVTIDEIDIKLRLSLLKPLHAGVDGRLIQPHDRRGQEDNRQWLDVIRDQGRHSFGAKRTAID